MEIQIQKLVTLSDRQAWNFSNWLWVTRRASTNLAPWRRNTYSMVWYFSWLLDVHWRVARYLLSNIQKSALVWLPFSPDNPENRSLLRMFFYQFFTQQPQFLSQLDILRLRNHRFHWTAIGIIQAGLVGGFLADGAVDRRLRSWKLKWSAVAFFVSSFKIWRPSSTEKLTLDGSFEKALK